MNTLLPLAERQQLVRQRLHNQRELIAQQLQPALSNSPLYPRSMTMRLLTARPAMSVQLLSQVASLLLGGRMLRTFNSALLVARVARGLTCQRRLRLLRQAPKVDG